MARVFISHSHEDHEFVIREIAPLLQGHGIVPWYAEHDIKTAQHWERIILEALRSCDWFLVVMSPRSARSEWVKDEVAWAMEYRKEHVVPVLLESCDPTAFHLRLGRIHCVDFSEGQDFAVAQRRLLDVWGAELERRKTDVAQTTEPTLRIASLLRALKSKDSKVRSGAAKALASIGKESVRHLVQALQDDDYRVRRQATEILGEIGPDAREAVPALIDTLQRMPICAARALGNVGPDAREALPAILEASYVIHPHEDAKKWWPMKERSRVYGSAIERIGPDAETIANLIGMLDQDICAPRLNIIAACILSELGSQAMEAVPALMKVDKSKWYFWRSEMRAVSRCAAAALESIQAQRADEDPDY